MNTPSMILASALVLIPENPAFAQAAVANAGHGHAAAASAMALRPATPPHAQPPAKRQDTDQTSAAYEPQPAYSDEAFAGVGCPFIASAP
ncbi:MAG TPA: hypothetical protein VL574_01520 [Stellaceae bacterium]|nr:hypothetical protein [Stellaceae bacterium]